jgi:predicted aspartyl protease
VHQGHAHFTTIEEIPASKVITTSKFLVNNHPTVVLFDSSASHSFINPSFASKFGQRIAAIDKGGYCISADGNNIATNQIVKDALINIEGHEYTSHLVLLPGLGIDVILGMNWMSGHGVLIDTSTHVVMLRDPINNEAFLV